MDTPESKPAAPPPDSQSASRGWSALAKVLVLAVLTGWVFHVEREKILWQATTMVQSSYVLVAPLLVGLLVFLRRRALIAALRPGSVVGVVLVVAAIAGYALTTWPFYHGYLRKLQFLTAFVGMVLAVGGWRVLWRSGPMLLILALAVPIGWYTFSSLVNQPERLTLRSAAALLNLLPETFVQVRGGDLHYLQRGVQSTIALGDYHSGFVAPVAYLTLCAFVVFSRIRPVGHLFVLLALSIPLAVVCNLIRIVLQGIITIYTQASPTAALPRNVALVTSLMLTYLAIAVCGVVLARLRVEADADEQDTDATLIADDGSQIT